MLLHYEAVITLSVDLIALSGSYYITGRLITLSVVTDISVDYSKLYRCSDVSPTRSVIGQSKRNECV